MRVNFQIKAPMIRVIDDEGKMLGVFQVADAVRMAYDKGLDLIEVAPDANPPTCKMMDFGKYKYQLKKKAAESKKKQVIITVKEIQFRPNTDDHDVDFKTRHILEFLAEGDKVRIIVTFRGREMAHQELGRSLIARILTTLKDSCVIEQNPTMDGKKLTALVAPAGTKVAAAPKPAAPAPRPAAPMAKPGQPAPATAGATAPAGEKKTP